MVTYVYLCREQEEKTPFFVLSFIHPFITDITSTYFIPGNVLGTFQKKAYVLLFLVHQVLKHKSHLILICLRGMDVNILI